MAFENRSGALHFVLRHRFSDDKLINKNNNIQRCSNKIMTNWEMKERMHLLTLHTHTRHTVLVWITCSSRGVCCLNGAQTHTVRLKHLTGLPRILSNAWEVSLFFARSVFRELDAEKENQTQRKQTRIRTWNIVRAAKMTTIAFPCFEIYLFLFFMIFEMDLMRKHSFIGNRSVYLSVQRNT